MTKTERAAQVCVDDRIPIFQRHPHGKGIARHTGVVNKHVDPFKVLKNSGTDFLDGRMICNIDRVSVRRIRSKTVNFVRDPPYVFFRSADTRYMRALNREA